MWCIPENQMLKRCLCVETRQNRTWANISTFEAYASFRLMHFANGSTEPSMDHAHSPSHFLTKNYIFCVASDAIRQALQRPQMFRKNQALQTGFPHQVYHLSVTSECSTIAMSAAGADFANMASSLLAGAKTAGIVGMIAAAQVASRAFQASESSLKVAANMGSTVLRTLSLPRERSSW